MYVCLGEKVSKKIKSLRSQYTREKQKERRNRELPVGELENTFVSKWMHYEKLNFLEDFVVPRQHTAGLKVSAWCCSHMTIAIWAIWVL